MNYYDSSRFPYISISSDNNSYFVDTAKREFDRSLELKMNINDMMQSIISDGNYIYYNVYGFERSQIVGTNSVDESFSYVTETEEQLLLVFDQDLIPVFYYHYIEGRVDHDLYTGAPLDEAAILNREMVSVEFEYGELEDLTDQDYPITALPENFLMNASLKYQFVPATVDEEGKLTAKPEFENQYDTGMFAYESVTKGRIDCINPISSNTGYAALAIGNIFLNYSNPATDEATDINFPIIGTEVLDKIVKQVGGQRLVFDNEEFIIVEVNNDLPSGFSITFPTIDEVNPSNIQVGDYTLYYLM